MSSNSVLIPGFQENTSSVKKIKAGYHSKSKRQMIMLTRVLRLVILYQCIHASAAFHVVNPVNAKLSNFASSQLSNHLSNGRRPRDLHALHQTQLNAMISEVPSGMIQFFPDGSFLNEETFEIRIHDFCKIKSDAGEKVCLPKFFRNGFQWYLEVYPRGNDAAVVDEEDQYISMYLIIVPESMGDTDECTVKFTLGISELDFHTEFTGTKFLKSFAELGWGQPDFINRRSIVDNPYRTDDSLTILGSIQVMNTESSRLKILADRLGDNWSETQWVRNMRLSRRRLLDSKKRWQGFRARAE